MKLRSEEGSEINMVAPGRENLLVDQHAAYVVKISQARGARTGTDTFNHGFTSLTARRRCQYGMMQSKQSFEYYATEHFRMSGVYWGLTALHLLGKVDAMSAEDVVDWVMQCQHANGGFGGSERHDPHLLYTLSALQVLALHDQLHRVDADTIATCEPPSCAEVALHAALLTWYIVERRTCRLPAAPQTCRACSSPTAPLPATNGARSTRASRTAR